MKIETIKVYKGSKDVIVNKSDLKMWQDNGWMTSSERSKKSAAKKSAAKEDDDKSSDSGNYKNGEKA